MLGRAGCWVYERGGGVTQYIINDVLCNPGGIHKQVLCVRPLMRAGILGPIWMLHRDQRWYREWDWHIKKQWVFVPAPVLDQCEHFCRTHSLHSPSDSCAVWVYHYSGDTSIWDVNWYSMLIVPVLYNVVTHFITIFTTSTQPLLALWSFASLSLANGPHRLTDSCASND